MQFAAGAVVLMSTVGACGSTTATPVTPIPVSSAWHAGLFVDGYGPAGLGPAATSGASAGPTDPLQITLAGLGLSTADFGTGYTVQLLSGGDGLTKSTLHFCGATYPSEKNRVARWLVGVYDSSGSPTGQISDSVAYGTETDALEALAEIRAALGTCAPNTVVNTGTTTLTADPRPSTDIKLTDAVPEAQRAVMTEFVTEPSSGASALIQTVWQIQGRYLVALTFQHDGNAAFSSQDQKTFDDLASLIASRLRDAPTTP
jgi:hypothetical protein